MKIDETERTIPGKTNGIFELDGVKMGVGIIMSNIERDEGIIIQELDLERQRKFRKEMPVLEQIK